MADPQYAGGRAVLALIKRHREKVVTAMKRHLGAIVYIALHAIVFGAMFLPPLWIPNHGNGNGYEYHLWLAAMFPIGSGAMGILAAFFPVKRQVRLIAAALLLLGLLFPGWVGTVFYVVCYAACFFAARLLIWMICSTMADYRAYQARKRD